VKQIDSVRGRVNATCHVQGWLGFSFDGLASKLSG